MRPAQATMIFGWEGNDPINTSSTKINANIIYTSVSGVGTAEGLNNCRLIGAGEKKFAFFFLFSPLSVLFFNGVKSILLMRTNRYAVNIC